MPTSAPLKSPPTASVDTLPTSTELELIPVWLLKALEGIFEPPFELEARLRVALRHRPHGDDPTLP